MAPALTSAEENVPIPVGCSPDCTLLTTTPESPTATQVRPWACPFHSHRPRTTKLAVSGQNVTQYFLQQTCIQHSQTPGRDASTGAPRLGACGGGEAMSTQHVPRAVRQCQLTGGLADCTAGPTQGRPEVGREAGYFYGAWVWRG